MVGSRIFCFEWRGSATKRTFVDIKMEDGLEVHPDRLPDEIRAPGVHA